jgi:4a-hydroxytetrahydrobiopterin dehydratase
MARLTDDEVHARLQELAGWERHGDAIRRTYKFGNFKDAMAFANRVAELAEAQDHHPDMLVQYGAVTLTLTSHDTGGLTARDFRLAQTIDA